MNSRDTGSPVPRSIFARIRERLANRPDTEHQAALIRIGFGVIMACYLLIALRVGLLDSSNQLSIYVFVTFMLCYSAIALGAILARPVVSILRRVTWIIIDNSIVTVSLYAFNEAVIPFYGLYLFNVCGNGFRFGQRYLIIASGFSIAGFVLVLYTSDYWLAHKMIGVGLLLILIIVPMYFSSLVKQLHTALSQMRAMATRDALTGLPNRHSFYEQLHLTIRRGEQKGTPFAVVFVDLDGFKPINDALGHAVGDAVLTSVSRRLEHCVRRHDIISRYGGDEFVIILNDIRKNEVPAVADKIIHAIEQPHELGNHTVSLTSSVGIATYPDGGHTVDELISRADSAMYQSKRAGGRSFCLDGAPHTVPRVGESAGLNA